MSLSFHGVGITPKEALASRRTCRQPDSPLIACGNPWGGTPLSYPSPGVRMRALTVVLALALVLLPTVSAHAQTGNALLKAVTNYTPVPNPSFPVPADAVYRAVWDASEGTEQPNESDPVFRSVASFLVMAEEAGVPRSNVQLALVVYGNAAKHLLQNDAYRAMTGTDNPNIPILEALHARGVQVIVCGQAIPNRKLPADKLLPFVRVSLSAGFAHVTLHSQGYFQF